jgi:hypothetical protein
MCGINDLGHTCDEYLVLFTKLGMTTWVGWLVTGELQATAMAAIRNGALGS